MHQRVALRCLRLLLLISPVVAGAIGIASPSLATERAKGESTFERAKGESTFEREMPVARPKLDRSGRKRFGVASVYARRFTGRKMADGTRMDPLDDNAASKTLPLGTEAKVTNLETGRSANVTIQDRGPYVKGRIVDLSPATAEQIGITPNRGVAKVEVEPIALPPRGEGARD
jgi:rare lipoprotein A